MKTQTTEWAVRTHDKNNTDKIRYTSKKTLTDICLKASSAAMMYGIGWLGGEILDNIPYINDAITQAVYFASNINVHDNLSGLVGVVSGAYGLFKSKLIIHDEILRPTDFKIYPIWRGMEK